MWYCDGGRLTLIEPMHFFLNSPLIRGAHESSSGGVCVVLGNIINTLANFNEISRQTRRRRSSLVCIRLFTNLLFRASCRPDLRSNSGDSLAPAFIWSRRGGHAKCGDISERRNPFGSFHIK